MYHYWHNYLRGVVDPAFEQKCASNGYLLLRRGDRTISRSCRMVGIKKRGLIVAVSSSDFYKIFKLGTKYSSTIIFDYRITNSAT